MEYRPAMLTLIMLYKVVLTLVLTSESLDKVLTCDHSQKDIG